MSIPNRLSEPRSFLGTAIIFGGPFGAWMLFWFSGVAVLIDGSSFTAAAASGRVLLQAALSAIFFGVTMGAMFRGETRRVRVRDSESFLASANVAAAELGFDPSFAGPSTLVFRPSWRAGRLAGSILVQLCGHDAVVVGPRIYVRRFASRLRSAS